jgi:diketogulonate reductase-like aldo/keto reductase
MPTTRLGGLDVPVLGQGTWNMGDDPARRKSEIQALQRGIDLGLSLIDTAEMYGEGASERLVGEAIADRRDAAFIVSKAYPHNASRSRLPQACERSLRNLGTDRIDLYLLHWRGSVPLAETIEAMQALHQAGKIRQWGVSNLDVDDMQELFDAGGAHCATDQILYNLTRRGPEYDLLPWLEERGIAAMAYSPVEQGRLKGHKALEKIAQRHAASDLQVALAWVLRREGVIAIPKAGSRPHVEDNAGALSLTLTEQDLAELDRAFPPPAGKRALEML